MEGTETPLGRCTPKITDFGLAKNLAGDSQHTQTGQVLGTPSYMAPEQAEGKREVGPPVDVYALGTILYELLTGHAPFRGESVQATLRLVLTQEPASFRVFSVDVPADLETVCLKCLEKDPARRYQSAAALAADLRRFLEGRATQARPLGALARGWRWAGRNRAVAGLLVSLVLMTTISTALAFRMAAEKGAAEVAREDAAAEARAAGIAREAESERARSEEQQRGRAAAFQRQAEEERERSYTALQQRILLPLRPFAGEPIPRDLTDELSVMPNARWGWECRRRLLESALGPWPTRVLAEHDWGVASALFSPDRRTLLTGGDDGRLLATDLAAGAVTELQKGDWDPRLRRYQWLAGLSEGADVTLALAWLRPGKTFAAATLSGSVHVWDLERRSRVRTLLRLGPRCALTGLAVSANGRRLAACDRRGRLHTMSPDGGEAKQLQLGPSPAVNVVPRPSGGWVAALEDGTVHLVDAAGEHLLGAVREPRGACDVALSPGGDRLAVVGKRLVLYRLKAGGDAPAFEDAHRPERGDAAYERVCFAPDGATLYLGDSQGRLTIHPLASGSPATVHPAPIATSRVMPESVPLVLRRAVTALAPSPDGRSLAVAGRNTVVTEWSLTPFTGKTTFRLDNLTAVCFDPVSPALLWAGTSDGRVLLVDSRRGEVLAGHAVDEQAVLCLEPAGRGRFVAGCAGGRICFLERAGLQVRAPGPEIRLGRPLRALTAGVRRGEDGAMLRVAAMDDRDTLTVWDGSTGQELARQSLRAEGDAQALTGRLAYNADGSLLAVCGPGATFWVFRGDDLGHATHPGNAVSGRGGTAVCWHPAQPGVVVVADSIGRIHLPAQVAGPGWPSLLADGYQSKPDVPVQTLAYSPDGRRLAAVTADRVLLLEPEHVGLVWQDRLRGRPAFAVRFDPTGHRLLVGDEGGTVTIWETGIDRLLFPPAAADEAPPLAWRETLLLSGKEARGLHLPTSQCAAVFDGRGRLGILYSHLEADDGRGARERVLRLGVWRGGVFERGKEVVRLADDTVSRGCTLFAQGERFVVAYRNVLPDTRGGNAAELVLVEEGPVEVKRLGPAGNSWFYPHVYPGRGGTLRLTHFSHGVHGVFLAEIDGEGAAHRQLGAYGDGFRHQAAAGADGTVHILSRPNLYDRVARPSVVYLRRDPGHRDAVREIVPFGWSSSSVALALAPDGQPIALGARVGPSGQQQLVLARRAADGKWRSEVVADWFPGTWLHSQVAVEALACGPTGTVHAVVVADRVDVGLLYLRGENGRWAAQRIAAESGHAQLLLDGQGSPAVLAWRRKGEEGALRLYTPGAEAEGRPASSE